MNAIQQWLQNHPSGNVRISNIGGGFAANLRVGGKNIVSGPVCADPTVAIETLHDVVAAGMQAKAPYKPEKLSGVSKKPTEYEEDPQSPEPTKASKVVAKAKTLLGDAGYRVIARKLVRGVKKRLAAQLAKAELDGTKAAVAAVLVSPVGDAVLAQLLAGMAGLIPLPAKLQAYVDVDRLAYELQTGGVTEALDYGSDLLLEPLMSAVGEIVPMITAAVGGVDAFAEAPAKKVVLDPALVKVAEEALAELSVEEVQAAEEAEAEELATAFAAMHVEPS